jgi:hypothetical protein
VKASGEAMTSDVGCSKIEVSEAPGSLRGGAPRWDDSLNVTVVEQGSGGEIPKLKVPKHLESLRVGATVCQ